MTLQYVKKLDQEWSLLKNRICSNVKDEGNTFYLQSGKVPLTALFMYENKSAQQKKLN